MSIVTNNSLDCSVKNPTDENLFKMELTEQQEEYDLVNYGKLSNGSIAFIGLTKKYVFVSDDQGNQKKFLINSGSTSSPSSRKDYGLIGLRHEPPFTQLKNSRKESTNAKQSYIICGLVCTEGHQFLCFKDGVVKQYTTEDVSQVKNHGKIHDSVIRAIDCSHNSTYLFTSDINGYVRQLSIKDTKSIHKNEKLHENPIVALCVSLCNTFQFSCDNKGHIKQTYQRSLKLVKDYGYVSGDAKSEAYDLKVTKQYLVVSLNNSIKLYSIEKKCLAKDFKEIFQGNGSISATEVMSCGKALFVSDCEGNLKKFGLENLEQIEDYRCVLKGKITVIKSDKNSKVVFVGDSMGGFKQICVKENYLEGSDMEKGVRVVVKEQFIKTEELQYLEQQQRNVEELIQVQNFENLSNQPQKYSEFEEILVGKINTVERKIDLLDKTFTGIIDSNLEQLIQKIDRVEKNVQKNERKLEILDKKSDRIDAIETKCNDMKNSLSQIDNKINLLLSVLTKN